MKCKTMNCLPTKNIDEISAENFIIAKRYRSILRNRRVCLKNKKSRKIYEPSIWKSFDSFKMESENMKRFHEFVANTRKN